MRERLEYAAVWAVLHVFGLLPRPIARRIASGLSTVIFRLQPKWRRGALFNLRLAFPDWTEAERERVLGNMVRKVGWILVEFAHFPHNTPEDKKRVFVIDGEENFDAAERLGKGILLLTGHLGAWELIPFARSIPEKPMYFIVRPIDNPRINALVNRYRSCSGNLPMNKDEAARGALRVLRKGGVVGILADQNTSIEEAVFADFFGVPAATTAGLARLARHTGAAVVPAYTFWDDSIGKYRVCAEPALTLVKSDDEQADILAYTTRFNQVLEAAIRRHPDQWLWAHRRWKTRPPGDAPIYPDQK